MAEPLGEAFGDGVTSGAEGTVCCGASEAVSGLKGRLVRKSARNVANVAAPIMLMAIHTSVFREVG